MNLDPYLVDIVTNDLKQALEEPVIFITQSDYIEHMFNSLAALKNAVISHHDDVDYTYFMELMTKHHTDWLLAIAEINAVAQIPIDNVQDSVSYSIKYTINCIENKPKQVQYFLKSKLKEQEIKLMEPHVKPIETVSKNMITALKGKYIFFKRCTDNEELAQAMRVEIDNLLDWLDGMYNKSIISLCKLLEVRCRDLGTKLHKALVITSQRIAESFVPDVGFTKLPALDNGHEDLHIKLSNNKSDTSSTLALMDLKRELEDKLKLSEATNKNYMSLKSSISTIVSMNINTLYKKMSVFNHQLSSKQRVRLVGQMIRIWKIVFGKRAYVKTNIPIVSIKCSQIIKGLTFLDKSSNICYYDNVGWNAVDRDIQKDIRENSKKSVVVLAEDVCKRLKETFTDGIEYHYDDIGRYFEEKGKKIYKDIDSDTEYEPDEFGNLIRFRRDPKEYFQMEFGSTSANKKDSEYLMNTVGKVLKKYLTKVVLYQPADPIKCLATLLIQHVKLEKEKAAQIESVNELEIERNEYRFKAQRTSSIRLVSETYCSDTSCLGLLNDSNLTNVFDADLLTKVRL